MSYQYRGDKTKLPPTFIDAKEAKRLGIKPCGTPAGYRRHRRWGEDACPDCKEANAAYKMAQRGGPNPRELKPCGTPAAYHRHVARGEPICEDCANANARYVAERNGWNFTGKRKNKVAPCGTTSGAQRHRNNGEDPCFACRVAEAANTAERRAAAREAQTTDQEMKIAS